MARRAWLLHLTLLVAAALVPLAGRGVADAGGDDGFPGWPRELDGAVLEPLPLTARERRFQDEFAGRVGRFTDGKREIIVRWTPRPTRKLHPSLVCLRAAGFTITPLPASTDAAGVSWSRFEAARGADRLLVRERVSGPGGASWPDVTAWYWAVALDGGDGPWWAYTIAERVR